MISIKKGLDLPISGQPTQAIKRTITPKKVALVGYDYVGMKPTMLVAVGDAVKKGQPLFSDKKTKGVVHTAPASGTITAINRGAKRAFESIEIEVSAEAGLTFEPLGRAGLHLVGREKVQKLLLDSGVWTSLRMRPFSKVAQPEDKPQAIFVTATDSNPLAVDPRLVIDAELEAFGQGLDALSCLTEGKVFVCVAKGHDLKNKLKVENSKTSFEEFGGKHPYGLVGTHIHKLFPVGGQRKVWHVNYQDLIAIGKLVATGEIYTKRVVSVAGPLCAAPCLIETEMGASTEELTEHLATNHTPRVVSGSLFNGRKASGNLTYLGRFHLQVSVIEESKKRFLLGWKMPGFERFSVKKVYAGAMFPWKKFDFTSNQNGSHRAIVPIGAYEGVMPLDIEATYLLRSLLADDLERCLELGVLELDEEDLALCSYVCPGKTDFGTSLRKMLTTIEREG